MPRRRTPPSQSWRTFLKNHLGSTVAVDFFAVPTLTCRILFVFVVLAHDRRRILHLNVTRHPTSAWTRQQLREAFSERHRGAIPPPRRRRDLRCGIRPNRRRVRPDVRPHCTALALAEGLRFILHLIGLIGEDVTGSAVRETSALHFDRGVRAWRLIEPFAFIVADSARKQAVLAPDLHGGGRDLQAARDLVPGQHPSRSKPLIPGAESVAVSEVFHDAALKRPAGA